MCSGPRKPSPPSSMDAAATKPPPLSSPESDSSSSLLELAASNDLSAFKQAAGGGAAECAAAWYSRTVGPASSTSGRRMAYSLRTPAMIAALYGSTDVLSFILSLNSGDINRRCGADGATALHCAAAGGSPASLAVVKLLIDASADVESLDAAGNRPGDVIAKQFSGSMARELEILLKASPCPRVSSPVKKEYPPDLTLPDIKNGFYGTDEFRMYTFKVKPCSRAYSHDWTECPFVHPGENARRRDPRKYSYSCVPCPDFRKGACLKGDGCEYAHGVFECWLHPAQYRTRLCKDETGCSRRVCFFAHKVEELRMVNPTAASVGGGGGGHVSSPRSAVSSLDMMAAAALMMQPMSPSGGSAAAWMSGSSQAAAAAAMSSRLKASLSARDLELDLELMGIEGYQQKLIDEISAGGGGGNWKSGGLNGNPDYSDLFGSIEPSVLSQLQGIALKNGAGYGNNMPVSPTAAGFDHSMAKAIMNSRQAAFAKRSQSFIDRGAVPRHLPAAPSSPVAVSDWGSPDGKLDWGIQGDELNKLRKSATFNFRGNGSKNFGGMALQAKATPADEPDLSWVQHLVKDGPVGTGLAPIGRIGLEQQKQYQRNGGGGGDFISWDQLYSEQERMQEVA